MSDVSRIIDAIGSGDARAAEQWLPILYEELKSIAARHLAGERPGHTLQPTALVHEAYLRLVESDGGKGFDCRGHFFAAAAEAMRRILIDNARRKRALRHGGESQRLDLDESLACIEPPSDDMLALDEALAKLVEEDPLKAQLVRLRCFAGLSLEEAAAALGISRATASRYWTYARAFLHLRVTGGNPGT